MSTVSGFGLVCSNLNIIHEASHTDMSLFTAGVGRSQVELRHHSHFSHKFGFPFIGLIILAPKTFLLVRSHRYYRFIFIRSSVEVDQGAILQLANVDKGDEVSRFERKTGVSAGPLYFSVVCCTQGPLRIERDYCTLLYVYHPRTRLKFLEKLLRYPWPSRKRTYFYTTYKKAAINLKSMSCGPRFSCHPPFAPYLRGFLHQSCPKFASIGRLSLVCSKQMRGA